MFVNSPGLIADFHALHRLLMPRHPPYALSSLATFIERSRSQAEPVPRTARIADDRQREMTCCYRVPGRRRGESWDVTIHPKRTLRTNHWSLSRACSPSEPACAGRPTAYSVKMPLLQLPNCQRTNRRATTARPGHILPAYRFSTRASVDARTANRQRPARHCEFLPGNRHLPYQPLATQVPFATCGLPPMSSAPSAETRNITVRTGPVKCCQW